MNAHGPQPVDAPHRRRPIVILFDLWRTLYLSIDKEPIRDVQEIFGHNLQQGDHGELHAEVDPRFLRKCLTTNCKDPKSFLSCVAAEFGYEVPPEGMARFMEILAREACGLARYRDVDETIAELKRRGYRLGVISNLWAFPEPLIFAADGFGDNFEHRIYSYEAGHQKPDPQIFLEACRRFGVAPEDCLMVGDHPKADAEGAVNVGMKAVIIDRPGTCRVQVPGVPVIRTLTELLNGLR